jgi:hypothetical protein
MGLQALVRFGCLGQRQFLDAQGELPAGEQ